VDRLHLTQADRYVELWLGTRAGGAVGRANLSLEKNRIQQKTLELRENWQNSEQALNSSRVSERTFKVAALHSWTGKKL
jgi:hypothetical protein